MFSRLLGRREKVQQGLRKSRESWYSRVVNIVQRSRLDEETWEELEEMLISADVGVSAAAELIEATRSKASERGARDVEHVMDILKSEIVEALSPAGIGAPAELPSGEGRPHVVLTVGVNGVGKTTSIAKLAHYYGEQGKQDPPVGFGYLSSGRYRPAANVGRPAWSGRDSARAGRRPGRHRL